MECKQIQKIGYPANQLDIPYFFYVGKMQVLKLWHHIKLL